MIPYSLVLEIPLGSAVGVSPGSTFVQPTKEACQLFPFVHATARSSTKNKDGQHDPDIHQPKQGNQWYLGMKAPVRVDSQSKLIHSLAATSAIVHDSWLLPELLHGQETRVWGDSAYAGQTEVIRKVAPYAQDFTHHNGHRHRPRVPRNAPRIAAS